MLKSLSLNFAKGRVFPEESGKSIGLEIGSKSTNGLTLKEERMSLKKYVKKLLNDPDIDESVKNNIRTLMASHLVTGMNLQSQGLLREAIAEFAKENDRPLNSDIDKEIVQKSYWHIGTAYRKLGENQNAKAAFEKALELWRLYRLGAAPHYDLAEVLIEEGQLDKAIELCQELVEQIPDGGIKQLLDRAIEMKDGRAE